LLSGGQHFPIQDPVWRYSGAPGTGLNSFLYEVIRGKAIEPLAVYSKGPLLEPPPMNDQSIRILSESTDY
jgi:hypothetical protein